MGGLCSALKNRNANPELRRLNLLRLQKLRHSHINKSRPVVRVLSAHQELKPEPMPSSRLLVIEGNSPQTLADHVAVSASLRARVIQISCANSCPSGGGHLLSGDLPLLPEGSSLEGYDGIAITGSGLHVYNAGPEVTRRSIGAGCAQNRDTAFRLLLGPPGNHCGSWRQCSQNRRAAKSASAGIRLTEAGRKHPVCRQARRFQRADRAS
jgi:hypothetical protein